MMLQRGEKKLTQAIEDELNAKDRIKEIVKAVIGTTDAPLIPDDIPIDTIIQPGDSSANFNKIEMLHASGSQKRIKTDLKDYTFDDKDNLQIIFISDSTITLNSQIESEQTVKIQIISISRMVIRK